MPLIFLLFVPALLWPGLAEAAGAAPASPAMDLTWHWAGLFSLAAFVLAYVFVVVEENLGLRKSKPVMVAAGAIWIAVMAAYHQQGRGAEAAEMLRRNFLEYAELAFFLLAAMTYINTLAERNLFQALRARLVAAGLSFRAIYWVTGALAFLMSPVADNLTTALVFGAVVLAVGEKNPAFVALACINIVVAANAGGAFSPFGDITTLMVWQKGKVTFFEFFTLFLPALASWLLPAGLMALAVSRSRPPAAAAGAAGVKKGGFVVAALFLLTIAMTVAMHHLLHLPPFLGMMTGLGLLKVYGYLIERDESRSWMPVPVAASPDYKPARKPFDIYVSMKRVEWDTLMFFYGIMLCVGGLDALGYLHGLSVLLYHDLGPTAANTLVGVLSAVIDNIPVMFAVLSMNPDMGHAQWLLVTLTAGIGGSLLSIGSAAGVALMGQARGAYTFLGHLKWSWAVALGYAAGVGLHLLLHGF